MSVREAGVDRNMTGSPVRGGEVLGRGLTHPPQIANTKRYSQVNNRPLFMSMKYWADFNQYLKIGPKDDAPFADITRGNYRFDRPPRTRSTFNRSVTVLYLNHRKPS